MKLLKSCQLAVIFGLATLSLPRTRPDSVHLHAHEVWVQNIYFTARSAAVEQYHITLLLFVFR